MYRFSRRTRAHDYAMMLATLLAFVLIAAGLIVASLASNVTDPNLSRQIESPAPHPAITSPRDRG
ncbi:MAG: hypothetical protein EOM92_07305 [Gammaproteobacteria bacterium]|jgi:hypothetical protein|nr:hypothetical protein [Gammaproteobacteria bacterium]